MIQTPQPKVSSQLTLKWVASYFKKAGVTVTAYRHDGAFLLTNSFLMVRVPAHSDLLPYTDFSEAWQAATFQGAKGEAEQYDGTGGPALWKRLEGMEVQYHLAVTRDLYEVPGERKKP